MMKSFLFALSLFLYFLIADILFVPLAMVPNYNLFLLLIFLLCCFILTYKAVAAESQVRRLIYGSFGGLLLWSLIGELCPSLKAHPASLLSPISTVDIKHPSTLVYLVLLFVTLTISYVKIQGLSQTYISGEAGLTDTFLKTPTAAWDLPIMSALHLPFEPTFQLKEQEKTSTAGPGIYCGEKHLRQVNLLPVFMTKVRRVSIIPTPVNTLGTIKSGSTIFTSMK